MVADPLKVAVDLDYRQDETQVDGHGLLLGQQVIGHLIQFTLRGVDGSLVLLYVLAQFLVALQICVYRGVDRLLRQRCHGQQLVFEFCELDLKMNARQDSLLLGTDCASCNVKVVRIFPDCTTSVTLFRPAGQTVPMWDRRSTDRNNVLAYHYGRRNQPSIFNAQHQPRRSPAD